MKLKKFEFNLFGENTYIIWSEEGGEAAVVDPGMVNDEEMEQVSRFLEEKGLTLKYVLLTHAHIDHTFGVEALREKYGVPVLAHKGDVPLAQMLGQQAKMFRLPIDMGAMEIDKFVDAQSMLNLGNERIEVIETPGHSPGGVCYYVPASGFVLTGDTLFAGSIGRTDLPGGSMYQLVDSIRRRLMLLPAATVVYAGHGPSTTIGREASENPYL